MASVTPASVAYKRLVDGNRRFVGGSLTHYIDFASRRLNANEGQDPFAAILSCADSRVIPELLFDQHMGDLFVVRVAGNVSNSASIASLEFAVSVLNVRLIVVLGHESCGAVGAAQDPKSHGPHLDHLLDQIRPALAGAGDSPIHAVECNARYSARHALEASEVLQRFPDLLIIPAFYWLNTGEVSWLEESGTTTSAEPL